VNTDMLDVCGAGSDCNPTPDGRQYTGHVSVTANGKQCQAWTSQSPHKHGYRSKHNMFPGGSVEAASNYCRNPSTFYAGLWCYTMDPNKRWGKCYVPTCGQLLRYVNYELNHWLRGCASPVLTATGFVNRRRQFLTPPLESTPLDRSPKICCW